MSQSSGNRPRARQPIYHILLGDIDHAELVA